MERTFSKPIEIRLVIACSQAVDIVVITKDGS